MLLAWQPFLNSQSNIKYKYHGPVKWLEKLDVLVIYIEEKYLLRNSEDILELIGHLGHWKKLYKTNKTLRQCPLKNGKNNKKVCK